MDPKNASALVEFSVKEVRPECKEKAIRVAQSASDGSSLELGQRPAPGGLLLEQIAETVIDRAEAECVHGPLVGQQHSAVLLKFDDPHAPRAARHVRHLRAEEQAA